MRTLIPACLAAATLGACADDIAPAAPDAGAPPTGKVQTTRGADGSYTTIVDATASDAWTVVDLESGGEAVDGDPWDLQVQRFHLALGVDVRVARLAGVALADVTAPPADGWLTDQPDDYAFERGDGWYAYDPTTHVLTPHEVVWVIETVEGSHLALEILAYYDDAGTSGVFTWHWTPLAAGGGS